MAKGKKATNKTVDRDLKFTVIVSGGDSFSMVSHHVVVRGIGATHETVREAMVLGLMAATGLCREDAVKSVKLFDTKPSECDFDLMVLNDHLVSHV